MRKFYSILVALTLSLCLLAQAPQKMSYQAVIRNSSDQLVTNHAIGMRISILQGTANGNEVYKEIYNPNPQTNANGLVSVEIGSGLASVGTFESIDWASDIYFIKTETDPTGGTNYSITGTSQMLSVPYALYAETSGTPGLKGDKGDTGDQGLKGDQGDPGLDGADGLTTSVNGVNQVSGIITLTKSDIGLGNVDNTSDASKSVSTMTQTALDFKVDKVAGKGLSSEDYTTAEKAKLSSISGTNTGDQDLTAMTHTNRSALDVVAGVNTGDQNLSGKVDKIDGKGLSSNDYTTLEQTKLSGIASGAEVNVNADWNATEGDVQIINKPVLAIVATSGNYNDLSNKPITDGSETKVTAGTKMIVTGTGTNTSPYVINSEGDPHYIGEFFGGGIIFWLSPDKKNGLIASLKDIDAGTGKYWSNVYSIIGSSAQSMTDGKSNTIAIINQNGHTGSAAYLCYTYSPGGNTGWYLPSNRELYLLASQDNLIDYILDNDGNSNTIGFFQENVPPQLGNYWSSTENSNSNCYLYSFDSGFMTLGSKSSSWRVRAIRAF